MDFGMINLKMFFAFENPCLTEEDRLIGKNVVENKNLANGINYCFVGGLNKNKGVDKIIDAFKKINSNKIQTLHIVGDGELRKKIEEDAKQLSINVIIHGSLPKIKVQEIYIKSHFIVLPSKSEGFPKVIGEAMNFGCVPIVSDISCIGQYVKNDKNGILIDPITLVELKKAIIQSLIIPQKKYETYIIKNFSLANQFTYSYYLKRIKNELFNY